MRVISAILAATIAAACTASVQGATGSWEVLSQGIANTLLAVSFTNSTLGIAPAGLDGTGAAVLRSTTGGRSWDLATGAKGLILLGGDASGPNVVASGFFSVVYSNNYGIDFAEAGQSNGDVVRGLSVAAADAKFFGVTGAGTVGDDDGVSVSENGGRNFTFHNISALRTMSRYGAFPSRKVWYITAGSWPENSNLKQQIYNEHKQHLSNVGIDIFHPATIIKPITRRIVAIAQQEAGSGLRGSNPIRSTTVVLRGEISSAADGWQAQIVKTSDGGNTWESVFWNEGNFYFNNIDCYDVDHCCAVGESDAGPTPGTRTHCTDDGGKTWTRTMFFENASMSLMAMSYVGPSGSKSKEAWAGGGYLSEEGFNGFFWHSVDGGHSWTNMTVPNLYASDISFPSSSNGFASFLTLEDGPGVAGYTA